MNNELFVKCTRLLKLCPVLTRLAIVDPVFGEDVGGQKQIHKEAAVFQRPRKS